MRYLEKIDLLNAKRRYWDFQYESALAHTDYDHATKALRALMLIERLLNRLIGQ